MQVGWGFVNVGWANCNGATIGINQNSALFSLLGTTFGGNGVSTFNLPDAQGRTLIGVGQGTGLANYAWGQKAGTENTTLTVSNMPSHNHTAAVTGASVTVSAAAVAGGSATPTSAFNVLGDTTAGARIYAPSGSTANVPLNGVVYTPGSVAVGLAGGNQPFSTLQPYLAVYTLIAMQGIFPTRS
jgi:microcystin-dependent protein